AQPCHAARQRLVDDGAGTGADRRVVRGEAAMSAVLLRGRVLSFRTRPESIDDRAAYVFEEDGGVLVRDGRIVATGDFSAIAAQAGDAKVVDHRPHLILPGFIDAHVHMPQMQVIASYGAELLDWLNTYT